MFDLPESKRVRREEIVASSRSPSLSPELQSQDGYARLGRLLNLDDLNSTNDSKDTSSPKSPSGKYKDELPDEGQEQEFEFRLFSAPARPQTSSPNDAQPHASEESGKKSGSTDRIHTQKLRVRLRSPTPEPTKPGEGKFIKPFRGWQYYFTTPQLLPTPGTAADTLSSKRVEYEDSAVTGSQIMGWAKEGIWPGCRMPWRVIYINRSKERQRLKLDTSKREGDIYSHINDVSVDSQLTRSLSKSRKRPGKKRRIVLRKRAAAAEAAKMTDAEKRNKKNRENKIKRRQKKREQKNTLAGGSASGD